MISFMAWENEVRKYTDMYEYMWSGMRVAHAPRHAAN